MNRVSAASRRGSPATVNLPSIGQRAGGGFDFYRQGHHGGNVGEQGGRGQKTGEQKAHCIQFTIKVESDFGRSHMHTPRVRVRARGEIASGQAQGTAGRRLFNEITGHRP